LNPYWDSNARGITLGWTGDHGPFHFYRAILEGIAYELRLHFEGVETALGDAIERLVVMGGGSNSELWCQIIADVSGKTLHRSDVVDGCALGAGMIAAYGAGWYATIQEAAKAMAGECRQLFHPNPDLTRRYTQIYEQVYQKIFPAIQSLVRRLSELTRE
jgi:xylulokinase